MKTNLEVKSNMQTIQDILNFLHKHQEVESIRVFQGYTVLKVYRDKVRINDWMDVDIKKIDKNTPIIFDKVNKY